MLVLIVLYDTYHIEVEASVHFGSFLYITGLDVIDVDNGVASSSVFTPMYALLLKMTERCEKRPPL